MKIVYVKIELLVPYANNAKKHSEEQIQAVARSIKEFGFVQPLVIDKKNNVIIGHCRLEGAKRLQFKEVPCLVADNLTEAQIVALRLADNKLNESSWDMDLALADLKLLPSELLTITGFNLDKLSDDLVDFADKNEEVNLDSMEGELDCECPKCGFKFKKK